MSKKSKRAIASQAELGVRAGPQVVAVVAVIPNNCAYWEKTGQSAWDWLAGVTDRFQYLRVYGAEVVFPQNATIARSIKLGGAR